MDDQYIQFHEHVLTPDGVTRLPHGILDRIKGAVALEYSAGGLAILVEHNYCFEWMDISYCIPVNSNREYALDPAEVVSTLKPKS